MPVGACAIIAWRTGKRGRPTTCCKNLGVLCRDSMWAVRGLGVEVGRGVGGLGVGVGWAWAARFLGFVVGGFVGPGVSVPLSVYLEEDVAVGVGVLTMT